MLDVLDKFEQEYAATVVDARHTGSHAWGYADSGSDIDVMAVFKYDSPAKYRSVSEDTEFVLVHPFDGELDAELVAWEVGEFGQRLMNSNTSAVSYLFSDVKYRDILEPQVVQLRETVEETFNPIQLYYDLRGMASDNYRKYLSDHVVNNDKELFVIQEDKDGSWVVQSNEDGESVREISKDNPRFTRSEVKQTIKKNLIVLRAVLRARFIVENYRETGEHRIPCPHLPKFIEQQAPVCASSDEIELLKDLLEKKQSGRGDEHIGDVVGFERVDSLGDISPQDYAREGVPPSEIDSFIREAFSI